MQVVWGYTYIYTFTTGRKALGNRMSMSQKHSSNYPTKKFFRRRIRKQAAFLTQWPPI